MSGNSSSGKQEHEKQESSKIKTAQDEPSDSASSELSNTQSGDSSESSQNTKKAKDRHKDASYEWRTFQMPTVPPPDDSQIEAQLNQYYDITVLFQQMRSVS